MKSYLFNAETAGNSKGYSFRVKADNLEGAWQEALTRCIAVGLIYAMHSLEFVGEGL